MACDPGEYSTEGDGYEPCNLCPDGSWQNETGESFCYKCDYGKPTGREGATSSSECGKQKICLIISNNNHLPGTVVCHIKYVKL